MRNKLRAPFLALSLAVAAPLSGCNDDAMDARVAHLQAGLSKAVDAQLALANELGPDCSVELVPSSDDDGPDLRVWGVQGIRFKIDTPMISDFIRIEYEEAIWTIQSKKTGECYSYDGFPNTDGSSALTPVDCPID